MNWIILNSNLKLKYIAKKICATTNYLLWKIFRKKETIEKTFDKSKVKNILVINLAYLGDVLVTLPMIKFLSKDKNIDILINPLKEKSSNKFTIKEILKENKFIQNIIAFEDEEDVLKKIKGKYDLAIVANSNYKKISNFLIRAKIPFRVAFCNYKSLKENFGFTNIVFPELDKISKVEENFKLLEGFKEKPKEINPEKFPIDFPMTKEEINLVAKKFNLPKKFMIISPGSRSQIKQGVKLPFPKTLAEVIDKLIKKYNKEIIILGAEWEKEIAEEIIKNTANKSRVKNLAGKTTIRESVAIINLAKAIIGVDSGSMHLAASQGTKIVDLIRKSQKKAWSPWIDSSKKRVIASKKNERLDLIKSEEIIRAAEEILKD